MFSFGDDGTTFVWRTRTGISRKRGQRAGLSQEHGAAKAIQTAFRRYSRRHNNCQHVGFAKMRSTVEVGWKDFEDPRNLKRGWSAFAMDNGWPPGSLLPKKPSPIMMTLQEDFRFEDLIGGHPLMEDDDYPIY